MQQYVLCFLYDKQSKHVALVRKNRPQWQAGKLNGIGGKVELWESVEEAAPREFLEEAGVSIPEKQWRHFLTFSGIGYAVHTFVAFDDKIFDCKTMEAEKIEVMEVDKINFAECVDNLKWIIPLSLTKAEMFSTVREVGE
jgi:8-oxo-dGTP diphosphatase